MSEFSSCERAKSTLRVFIPPEGLTLHRFSRVTDLPEHNIASVNLGRGYKEEAWLTQLKRTKSFEEWKHHKEHWEQAVWWGNWYIFFIRAHLINNAQCSWLNSHQSILAANNLQIHIAAWMLWEELTNKKVKLLLFEQKQRKHLLQMANIAGGRIMTGHTARSVSSQQEERPEFESSCWLVPFCLGSASPVVFLLHMVC